MSATMRLRLLGSILTGSAAIAGLSTLPTIRDHFPFNQLGSKTTWRILALLFALLNFKNLPFVWHIRVLRGVLYQLYFQPITQKPRHLFAPLITSSYNSPMDCDYNFHKSNSTYFADLDVARANFMSCIVRTGLARLNRGDEEGLPKTTTDVGGKYFIALGAVSCFFQRQIEPMQSYEIYTRLLAWDRKWIYSVSHIVKKGVIKPNSYVLQPWKKGRKQSTAVAEAQRKEEEDLSKHVFATSVARYVFKKGRKTINPEIVLERSRLLPPRPEGVGLPPRMEAEWAEGTSTPATPAMNGAAGQTSTTLLHEAANRLSQAAAKTDAADDGDLWTWDDMEQERLRGLRLASHLDALGAVQSEFRASEVLGQYGDYW